MKGSGGGSNEITGAWYITDVPLCVLLGSVVGALMSFSTAAATAIARVKRSAMAGREVTTTTSGASWKNANSLGAPKKRKKRNSSKVSEIVAAVFPVVLVSVLAFVLPLLFECRVRQDHVKGKPGASHLLGGQHQVDHFSNPTTFFQYKTDTLFLFITDEETYGDASLVTLATCYYFFPLFVIGCSFPFGLFVPNLVFGSAVGHLFGRLVNRSVWLGASRVAHPTTYAVLGAGAALGGWTRMAIAISAIMLEQTGNMDSVILMMVTVLSSRLVAGILTPQSFTDEIIAMKGYQVLEPREPPVIATLSVGAVCTRHVVCLRPNETVASVCRVLLHTTHTAFPVCSDDAENSFSDRDNDSSYPVWRVETGGQYPSPTVHGLVARSVLLATLTQMVNEKRPSENDARRLRVPSSMLADPIFLGVHDGVVPVVRISRIPHSASLVAHTALTFLFLQSGRARGDSRAPSRVAGVRKVCVTRRAKSGGGGERGRHTASGDNHAGGFGGSGGGFRGPRDQSRGGVQAPAKRRGTREPPRAGRRIDGEGFVTLLIVKHYF